jgi:hypothetical protein
MSTKAEHARNIADKLYTRCGPGEHVTEAIILLREFAERLDAVAVSDAMVESVGKALYIYWDDVTKSAQGKYREKVRHALESILPIADEQDMDAERYRWLRHGDNDELVLRELPSGGQYLLRNEALDEAIDRAVASAKGDANG